MLLPEPLLVMGSEKLFFVTPKNHKGKNSVNGLNPKHFASEGHEGDAGEYDAEDRRLLNEIKKAWPELSVWGDLPVGVAWGSYSQDVYLISWLEATQHSLDRESLIEFIAYIHLHDTDGVPEWGITPEALKNYATKNHIK